VNQGRALGSLKRSPGSFIDKSAPLSPRRRLDRGDICVNGNARATALYICSESFGSIDMGEREREGERESERASDRLSVVTSALFCPLPRGFIFYLAIARRESRWGGWGQRKKKRKKSGREREREKYIKICGSKRKTTTPPGGSCKFFGIRIDIAHAQAASFFLLRRGRMKRREKESILRARARCRNYDRSGRSRERTVKPRSVER